MSILKLKDSQGNWVGVPTIKGDSGNGISSAVLNSNYTLTLTFTDGTTYTTPSIRGEKGEQGDPATSMEIHICSSSEYDSQTRIPTIQNPNNKTFYLVPTADGTSPDLFTEWVYVNNAWEMFGSASVDLSGYLTDVQINNSSIVSNGVATIPIGNSETYGVFKINSANGIFSDRGTLAINNASESDIKTGIAELKPITPNREHIATFYGLAKAAGHDEKNSILSVGQYTDEAKSSIQDMLDVPSNADLDEVEEKVEQNTEDLLKAFPVETVSGNIVSFEDGANNIPLQSLVVDIEPVQDLHGQSNPYPAGGGKNKAIPLTTTLTVNGVTVTCSAESETITLTGTGTSNGGRYAHLTENITLPAGTYILSITGTHSGSYNVNKSDGGTFINGENSSFTLSEETTVYVGVNVVNGTAYNETVKVQLESGTTATSYAPYSNICPISGWTGMNVSRTGKNLFNTNFSDYTKPYDYYIKPIKLESGKRYVLTAELVGTAVTGTAFGITKKGDKYSEFAPYLVVATSGTVASFEFVVDDSFTSPKLIAYVSGQAKFDEVMSNYNITLEVKADQNAYEPYNGNTINVDWTDEAGTIYGGKLDVLNGLLTVDRATVDLGDINWNYYSSYASFAAIVNGKTILSSSVPYNYGITTSIYPAVNYWWTSAAKPDKSISNGADANVVVKDSSYTSATDFKMAMSGQQLVYELAEPITYQLTPQQINSLLGQNNIWANTGNTSVEYRADTEMYIEKVKPVVNVDDVQINGASIVSDGVANIPYAAYNKVGVVQVNASRGTAMSGSTISTFPVDSATVKAGTQGYQPITPAHQHESVFYGLAKASGDSTQASSNNAVGTYTDEAKSSIQNMLGLDDVIRDTDYADADTAGVVKADADWGVGMYDPAWSGGEYGNFLYLSPASSSQIKTGSTSYKAIVPNTQHESVFYGLAKSAGDTTQSQSSNPVGTYTDDAKSAIRDMVGAASDEEVSDLKENLNNKAPVITETASGAIASFSDGADGMPMKSLVVDIEPVQDLHGQDAPYPAGGGANKIAWEDGIDFTLNGIRYYVSGGKLYLNGTSTGETSSANITFYNQFKFNLQAGSYHFSRMTGTLPSYLCHYVDGTITSLVTNNGEFTLLQDEEVWVGFYVYEKTFNNEQMPVQIVSGSTAQSAFFPYSNICPITGWTGVTVSGTGKNLSPITSWSGHSGTPVTFDCAIKANTTVIMSGMFARDGSSTNDCALVFRYADGTMSGWYNIPVNSGVRKTATATPTKDVTGIAYYAHNSGWSESQNYTLTVSDFQLELASTATDYEPYNGTTVNVDWQSEAGTVYGGTLDVVSGELVVDRQIVDLGSLNWSGYTGYEGLWFANNTNLGFVIPASNTRLPSALCSKYVGAISRDIGTSGHTRGEFALADPQRIYIADDSYATREEFKASLNGVQLVYELATPITYHLTPTEVQSILGQNHVWADTGDASVEYCADTKLFIERLTQPDTADLIADTNITSGQYFMVGNDLYKATNNIANGSVIIVGTNCTRKSLSEALNEINS